MLIVKVYTSVHERMVTKKDGTEFKIRFQEGEMLQENRRPRVVEIPVPGEGHLQRGAIHSRGRIIPAQQLRKARNEVSYADTP